MHIQVLQLRMYRDFKAFSGGFHDEWQSGWWLTYPSEKYESQLGWLFPIYGKTKNISNHQPAMHVFLFPTTFHTPKYPKCGDSIESMFKPTGWKPNQRFACFYVFHGVNGVGWGGLITFICTTSHTWCYATPCLLALPHIYDATLLYVFLNFLT